MFIIQAEEHFDSAHFLKGYAGKCANLHGHRWRVEVAVGSETLKEDAEQSGMVCDFGDIKNALKSITESLDHKFVYERGTLKETTVEALKEEGFEMVVIDFRPTAENFAKFFFDQLEAILPGIQKVVVYETPKNCATYWR